MPRTYTPTSATQKSDEEAQPSMPPTLAVHPQEESEPATATADISTEETPACSEDPDSDADADSGSSEDYDEAFDEEGLTVRRFDDGSIFVSCGCSYKTIMKYTGTGNGARSEGRGRWRAISTEETDTMEERHAYWDDVKRRCEEEICAAEAPEAANSSH